jgi:pimeloyl-ACP methyl ester carboxylesterase
MGAARPETTAPDLWVPFEGMRCPVLVVRGGVSDVLSSSTVEEMVGRGAECAAVEVEGVGHAPALTEPEALGAIREFLAPLRAPGGR